MIRHLYIQNGVLVIISRIKSKIQAFKSLRAQSMAVLILIGIIPLVVFTLIFINTYRAKAISQRINELQTHEVPLYVTLLFLLPILPVIQGQK